jgi:hypothetical protein
MINVCDICGEYVEEKDLIEVHDEDANELILICEDCYLEEQDE